MEIFFVIMNVVMQYIQICVQTEYYPPQSTLFTLSTKQEIREIARYIILHCDGGRE